MSNDETFEGHLANIPNQDDRENVARLQAAIEIIIESQGSDLKGGGVLEIEFCGHGFVNTIAYMSNEHIAAVVQAAVSNAKVEDAFSKLSGGMGAPLGTKMAG